MPTGEQPADIEFQIRDMWLSYISDPDSIILAVSAATQDIVGCEAIKTALEVDMYGSRTIGAFQGTAAGGLRRILSVGTSFESSPLSPTL